MPVLPLVASTTVWPGFSSPDFSAASITPSARRSFTEPSGLKASTLTNRFTPAGASRLMRTTGVPPTVSRMLSYFAMVSLRQRRRRLRPRFRSCQPNVVLETTLTSSQGGAAPGRRQSGATRMTLEVIGSGFGRTGTLSLKGALETLGFGPCYHMVEVFKTPQAPDWWYEAACNPAHADWAKIFAGYNATVDWPNATFY